VLNLDESTNTKMTIRKSAILRVLSVNGAAQSGKE